MSIISGETVATFGRRGGVDRFVDGVAADHFVGLCALVAGMRIDEVPATAYCSVILGKGQGGGARSRAVTRS